MSKKRPIIGITANYKITNKRHRHTVRNKYVEAVLRGTGAMPLIIPATGDRTDVRKLLKILDGILFTGSSSHLHPWHYGENPMHFSKKYDRRRDATTMPLMKEAIAKGVPIFCICRGFQELNVIHGGTIHQELHEVEGMMDHREPQDKNVAYPDRYKPRHEVKFRRGGYLRQLTGMTKLMVNSLHHQGINKLGEGLVAEAKAADGTIEAIRVEKAKSFALGVQWHPEWLFEEEDGVSEILLSAFFSAVKSN